ncbi:hypothetical protein [Alkalihalobacillus sp. R86527]|uniref:hypothetical protein n=1 Tax=Alkalihalobacillus sp. R86527 TaxID=3093863 RepID=UPI00366E9AF2
MLSNTMSTMDFIALMIVYALIFTIYLYKEKVKEERKRIAQLEKENTKLKEAVTFYREHRKFK